MESGEDIVSRVHADDVARARKHIRAAIELASGDWIPLNAIADALAEEHAALGRPAACLPGHAARQRSRRSD